MYLHRTLDLYKLVNQKSFFLFGPRATGKTSIIQHQLKDAHIINLLRSEIFIRLSASPWELETIIDALPSHTVIVIDEIQKIPLLLDEVHRLIEEKHIKFLLTGSSARKLKHNHVNLLAGRAWEAHLFPLIRQEIPDFDLDRYLNYGGLPTVYLSRYPKEELIAYVNTYLKEEIQAEAIVRKIHSFSKFLQTSALTSGQMLNYHSLSNDVGIPTSTIREYYQILQDTLVGFLLPAFTKTIKRKAISTAKFYFFDIGVRNQLAGIQTIDKNSNLYGEAFEHFMAMELRAYIHYHRKHLPLSYWASERGKEVDFIIGDQIAIEIKTTHTVHDKHLKGLKMFAEENICTEYFLISFDKINRRVDNIHIMYWEDFLDQLWSGCYL